MRVSAIANLKLFKHKVLYAGSCRLPWRTFKKLHTSLDHHQSPFSAGPTQGATHLAKHQINSLLQDSLHESCSTAVGPYRKARHLTINQTTAPLVRNCGLPAGLDKMDQTLPPASLMRKCRLPSRTLTKSYTPH